MSIGTRYYDDKDRILEVGADPETGWFRVIRKRRRINSPILPETKKQGECQTNLELYAEKKGYEAVDDDIKPLERPYGDVPDLSNQEDL